MDDGYDNPEWGESSGMRGSSEMGDVSFAFLMLFPLKIDNTESSRSLTKYVISL